MAQASVQMVLVEGENADGALVEEDEFEVAAADDSDPTSSPDQVISAILGTREGAAEAGFELASIGVTWTDQTEAAILRDALSAYKLENVMLVSAFLAAAALAQSVGGAMGYERTAVLFVEPDTATLAVVETSDGSIVDVYKEPIDADSYDEVTAQLGGMVYALEELDFAPGGLFLLGSGVDIAAIKPALESATSLNVSVPEEPETALARGAALASANAPLFASSTAALAYAQDPGTGAVDPFILPEYVATPRRTVDEFGDDLAYSLVADDDAEALTVVIDTPDAFALNGTQPRRRPVLLLGSGLAVVTISAVVALEIALAIGIRNTTVALQPSPNQSLIVPAQEAPAPPRIEASAPAPRISLPAPVAAPRPFIPQAAAVPIPAAPPLPAAPVVPVPVVAPPIVPVPLPAARLPFLLNPMMNSPLMQAPQLFSPPQRVWTQPPPVRMPEPVSPPEGFGTAPHSPPHEFPPGQGGPFPSEGGGHGPFPGVGPGIGGGHGGGPFGGGGEPAAPPLFGGGHGGGPFGGGGGPLGGGGFGGGPFGGGGGPLGGFGGGHGFGGGGGFGGGHFGGGGGFGGGHGGGGHH
ncbi:MAG TPA: hypothetical protein VGC05_01415 [Mycobacterium sp.]